MSNRLIHESSPYLLQHANNPVDWYPWGEAAFSKAKEENKLVLVSIGYSACHWCHVMEHESFEDEDVSLLMNENFICIKVDREERPDVDSVYMTAVQIMTGSGGWPLNCFTLPDGRPVYGGTYFQKEQWMKVLQTLSGYFRNEPEKVFQYADELTTAVKQAELIPAFTDKPAFTKAILDSCYENWQKRFDNNEGGPSRIPKFPLPNNYQFLLRYSQTLGQWEQANLLKHIDLTLTKMAYGGIYDQIGGGFSRYSTDGYWKVPHFEKMLYDNAQLVSLYSEAYQLTKNNLYKEVVYETLEFIRREMTSADGGFYSALDADSEGEEGKYYVWTTEELQGILKNDLPLFSEYFNVNEIGLWEDENHILLRKRSDEDISKKFGITLDELRKKISEMKMKVLSAREKRIKPGLDNKILTSWNAMMIKAYADAYSVFHEKEFLNAALKCAEYIQKYLSKEDGGLLHAKGINGFMEDYAFTSGAFISLYAVTFDESWLQKARSLADHAILHFHDPVSSMFYFTSDQDPALIARKMEIQDNVIPSSNSVMALTLFYLGKYFEDKRYLELSEKMLKQVQQELQQYGTGYSNWAQLMLHFTQPFHEIAIVGNSVDEIRKAMAKRYLPNAIFVGGLTPALSDLAPPKRFAKARGEGGTSIPLLKNKWVEGKTLIYICENKTCKTPTESIEEAWSQVKL
jgi:hypothetical protein